MVQYTVNGFLNGSWILPEFLKGLHSKRQNFYETRSTPIKNVRSKYANLVNEEKPNQNGGSGFKSGLISIQTNEMKKSSNEEKLEPGKKRACNFRITHLMRGWLADLDPYN